MRNRIVAWLAAMATVIGLTLVAAPAFAIQANVCHRDAGLSEGILVQKSGEGLPAGHLSATKGYLYKGECSSAKWGWADAQYMYVPSNRRIKSWCQLGTGEWVPLMQTNVGPFWIHTANYACGNDPDDFQKIRLSIHTP